MGITLEAQVVFYEVGVVELRHDVDLLADVLLLQGGLADGLGGQEVALGILDEEDLAEGAGSNGLDGLVVVLLKEFVDEFEFHFLFDHSSRE